MKVKIDTKEKMQVITIEEKQLAANMTGELRSSLTFFLTQPIKNIVVNFEDVDEIDKIVADMLVDVQQNFYDSQNSMVFCNLHPDVEKFLEENDFLELMNVTPTESEAWDIVQMEEIEREFF
ncbi:MAG: STAS domain-containing protein [Bacteroidota bacterium]|nr:STAS domain-containing protein [Bacteroidota bacterium]